jgi:Rrf2 family protein
MKEQQNMQINVTTDYAIRTVLYLALRGGEVVTSAEISQTMKIPQEYIITLTKRLRDNGILRTERGTKGGYALNKEPWNITLWEIVNVMEGTTRINRCLEGDHYCSRHAIETCPVRKNYEKLQQIFDDTLSGITIESLM